MNASRSTTMRAPVSDETGDTPQPPRVDAADMPDPDAVPASEQVVLIEFRWRSPLGVQPVLLLERHYLH